MSFPYNQLKQLAKMKYEINNEIEVPEIGFFGLETWLGTVVGITKENYIIDLGEGTKGHPRFTTRRIKDYEDK